MHENKLQKERVLLVGANIASDATFDSQMQELSRLTETAGGEVVSALTQNLVRPDARYLIGSGKLSELTDLVEAREIDTVIFNNRLTPRQNTNLETVLNIKVIDRMQLILDIFALRARTKEGMLQVEVAQLEYLLPRLVGQGIALSRQGGGIGSRGPGESQLETDRRHIRERMEFLERQLKEVEKSRQIQRRKRSSSGIYKIGLIGYTNAGKSTIMNVLAPSDAKVYEQDELFATLDATTRLIKLGDTGFQASLTDTVGFIQNLPTELVKAFKSTLEESSDVDLLVHVIDASAPDHEIHENTVMTLIDELGWSDKPILTLYNKLDLASDAFQPTLTPSDSLSARAADASSRLTHILLAKLTQEFEHFDLTVPFDKAYKLAKLRQTALVEQQDELDIGYHLTGFIPPDKKWQLQEISDII